MGKEGKARCSLKGKRRGGDGAPKGKRDAHWVPFRLVQQRRKKRKGGEEKRGEKGPEGLAVLSLVPYDLLQEEKGRGQKKRGSRPSWSSAAVEEKEKKEGGLNVGGHPLLLQPFSTGKRKKEEERTSGKRGRVFGTDSPCSSAGKMERKKGKGTGKEGILWCSSRCLLLSLEGEKREVSRRKEKPDLSQFLGRRKGKGKRERLWKKKVNSPVQDRAVRPRACGKRKGGKRGRRKGPDHPLRVFFLPLGIEKREKKGKKGGRARHSMRKKTPYGSHVHLFSLPAGTTSCWRGGKKKEGEREEKEREKKKKRAAGGPSRSLHHLRAFLPGKERKKKGEGKKRTSRRKERAAAVNDFTLQIRTASRQKKKKKKGRKIEEKKGTGAVG